MLYVLVTITIPDQMDTLYVVLAISNPVRFSIRHKLYRDDRQRLLCTPGVHLVTVEHALGERSHEVTCEEVSKDETHIRVRNGSHLWLKENLQKIAIAHIPKGQRYICCKDADVMHARPDWAQETIQMLQHHDAVQTFAFAQNLGERYELKETSTGFAYEYRKNGLKNVVETGDATNGQPGTYYAAEVPRGFNRIQSYLGHPGFSWAYRREFLDAVGGIMDWPILGSADHHMAWALAGNVMRSIPGQIHPEYKRLAKLWQQRATDFCHHNVGYVEGTLLHFFHGQMQNRKYLDRWKILIDNQYNPSEDILHDAQGVLTLDPKRWRLRDQILQYWWDREEYGPGATL
jgi:hypothetical protein